MNASRTTVIAAFIASTTFLAASVIAALPAPPAPPAPPLRRLPRRPPLIRHHR
jgi:hypothetical protein